MLIFVYNADSGLYNTLSDIAHKIFSPQTYACNLCAITYGNFGIRQEWKEFLDALAMPMEFLHRDEFHARYGMPDLPLPAILLKADGEPEVIVGAEDISRCSTIDELKAVVRNSLPGS